MEQSATEQRSRVPSHLQHFHPPNLTTEPLLTKAPRSYTRAPTAQYTQSQRLSPPVIQIPKRSWSELAVDILLKDWLGTNRAQVAQSKSYVRERLPIMRMKDSPDYITARAANPWTGVVSPSVGSSTPSLIVTPRTPGEALQLSPDELPPSPTPEARSRPPLKRVNDGHRWCIGTVAAATSPRVSNIKADARLASLPTLKDDQFVIRMPSAHEPQPYIYPGCSPEQIAAFEHLKYKASHDSGERYYHSPRKKSHTMSSGARSATQECATGRAVDKSGTQPLSGGIKVSKRKGRNFEIEDLVNHGVYETGLGLDIPNLTQVASSKTPVVARYEDSGSARKPLPDTPVESKETRRKAVSSKKQDTMEEQKLDSFNTPADSSWSPHREKGIAPTYCDLSHLPRITLVYPSLASLSSSHPHRQGVRLVDRRTTGCCRETIKEPGTNTWEGRRVATAHSTRTHTPSLLDDEPNLEENGASADMSQCECSCLAYECGRPARSADLASNKKMAQRPVNKDSPSMDDSTTAGAEEDHSKSQGADREQDSFHLALHVSAIFVSAIAGVFDACKHIQLPVTSRFRLCNVLNADDMTRQEKIHALSIMLRSITKLVAFLVVVAVCWKVGAVVVHFLEVVFLPLIVIFRILKWLTVSR